MTAQAGNLTLQDCDISRVFPRLSVDTFCSVPGADSGPESSADAGVGGDAGI